MAPSDGLDEVADEGERALVAQAIGDLLANDPDLRGRDLLDRCLPGPERALRRFPGSVRVRPLDQPRMESLVRRYYGAICSGDRARRTDGLLAQIGARTNRRGHGNRVSPLRSRRPRSPSA
ncbi:MAG: hypothetical protein H0U97_20565 [Gammaproteobacteria bacterium]|nr:hypothetical protein [Gammaproteobacteria bacterium]